MQPSTAYPYAVRMDHVSRYFGPVRALDELTLEVPSGVVFGFLGPNGAGKTTAIRLLLGLLDPTQGKAEVLGLDTRSHAGEIRQKCGALMEHNGLYERLSAEDNLEFYGRIWHIPHAERLSRIRELLTHFGLYDRRKELVRGWSHGMKQKLAVARALLHHPSLVFLDEPTAGLDPVAAAALRADLASLAEKEGVTVFLTTHNLAEAEKLCHRVGVIRQGQLLATGAPDQLRAREKPRVVVTGDGFTGSLLSDLRSQPLVAAIEVQDHRLVLELKEAASIASLVNLMVSSGARLEEVRKEKASLEDVFLTLMDEKETESSL